MAMREFDMIIKLKEDRKYGIKISSIPFYPDKRYLAYEEDGKCVISYDDTHRYKISSQARSKYFDVVNTCIDCGDEFISNNVALSCPRCLERRRKDFVKNFDLEDVKAAAQQSMNALNTLNK